VRAGEEETVLGPHDSLTIGPNVERHILNKTNEPVSMIVVMPYPKPS
jgi:mannose-6-phosphate isomerase-like protein (cupin superfamily)